MLDIKVKSKSFNNKEILNSININIQEGEFVSLVGPSGCGKTTLLGLISRLDEEFSGEILFNEKSIDFEIGYMFQDSRLLPWLTVRENLLLVLKDKSKEHLVEELLKEVELEEYINAYIKELSGGMQRRIALCRAFINQSEIILLDEPFISLDHPSAQELRTIFMKFYKKYKPTVVLVTHDLTEAISLSNRILFFSSKPTKIVSTYINTKDFSSNLYDEGIDIVKKDILEKNPNILSGDIS